MKRIVAFALKQQALMLATFVFVCAAGLVRFTRLNIEAYPDPVPPLVDIVTQNPGQSAEEIERYVTIPLDIQMVGLPHIASIRTISLFGLSDVKLQFTYDVSYEKAEQLAINALGQVTSLPSAAKPQISPWSPIGEIFRYRVVGPPEYSLTDLRTIEDWQLERRFKSVPGVIDVNGWGGKSKTYEVAVDLDKLNDAGLTLAQVVQALDSNNQNVGGDTLNFGPHAAVVRGVALVQSLGAIRDTLIYRPTAGSRFSYATSPMSRKATRPASASPVRTTTMTSCRALCSCAGASRRPRPSGGSRPRWTRSTVRESCPKACISKRSTTAPS
jgi:cobalt-zinc-cadmium resistance protein CzcA